MVSRARLALLVVLASSAGCPALSSGEPPALTVDNRDETQYRLTVFAVPDVDHRTDVAFRATTEAGDRRYVGLADLQSGAPYADVTLADAGGHRRHLPVPPASNVTVSVDEWNPGAAWGYLLERDDESLVAADVITCERYGQEARATVTDGFRKRWTSSCP